MFALSAESKKKVSWCWIFNQITIICVASVITSRNKLNIFSHIKVFLPENGFLKLCDLFYHMEREKNSRSTKTECEIHQKRYHCIVMNLPLSPCHWILTAMQGICTYQENVVTLYGIFSIKVVILSFIDHLFKMFHSMTELHCTAAMMRHDQYY